MLCCIMKKRGYVEGIMELEKGVGGIIITNLVGLSRSATLVALVRLEGKRNICIEGGRKWY